ncbi:MAG: DUF3347 domain-containing protein [Myxococcota bacterium]
MTKTFVTGVVALCLGLAPACGKAESGGPGGAAGGKASDGAPVKVAPVIAAYDVVREALASDDVAAAKAAAAKLAAAAKDEAPKLVALAQATADAASIEDVRKAFGELSKGLFETIKEKPALGEGLIAFRCPMTETYQKWVQLGRPLRNPYMGSKMLECGSKADMTP